MKNKKKRILLKAFRIQLWITTLVFLAYLLVAFGNGENFFADDFKNKKEVAGSVVSAMIKIFGTPNQPVVTGAAHCDANSFSYVRLDWAVEDDATAYDVYRDGQILALDLVDNFYVDLNVVNESSHNYYVVARGPAGQATSEEIVVLIQACEPQLVPFVKVNVFNGKNIQDTNQLIETKNRKPYFGGVTNIENALIEIEIRGESVFYATTRANQNGVWQWSADANFPLGTYVVYVKAINESDNNIFADCFLTFKIRAEEDEEDDNKKAVETSLSPEQRDEGIYKEKEKPFDFDLSLENSVYIKGVDMSDEAYRGESLRVRIAFSQMDIMSGFLEVNYSLLDQNRNVVAKYSDRIKVRDDMIIDKEIILPYNFELGKYNLKISATVDNVTVSHEGYFNLVDRPIVKLGTGAYITYADIVSNLGWLAVVSTLFLGFFSLLAIWEHHLYKRGVFHITEGILKKKGFID